MRKTANSYVTFLMIIILMLVPLGVVIASDVDDAEYLTTITYTNSADALTDAIGTFTLSTADMITGGMLNATANDCALLTGTGGSDIKFMPSVNSTYPWVSWVSSVGASSSVQQYLYSGGASGGEIVYFPGAAGMAVPDSMEPGGNFTASINGRVNTSASSINASLIKKGGAFNLRIGATDNITFDILGGNTDNVTPSGTNDPDSAWTNDANAIDANVATYATNSVGADSWSEAFEVTFSATSITGAAFNVECQATDPTQANVDYYRTTTATWYDINSAVVADDTWYRWTLPNPTDEDVTKLRIYIYNDDATDKSCEINELDYLANSVNVTVSATVTGAERVVTPGLHTGEYSTEVDYGDVLDFPGSTGATSMVDFGSILNGNYISVATLFELDNDWKSGSWSEQYFGYKYADSENYLNVYLKDDGRIYLTLEVGNVIVMNLYSVITSLDADTIYCLYFATGQGTGGGAPSDGARLYINDANDTTYTDADTTLPPAANFRVGTRRGNAGDSNGFDGKIHAIFIMTDNVTAAEEANIKLGIPPDDAVGVYLFDEGTGTTITDYGTGDNDGTAGAACTWGEGQTITDCWLDIDGTKYGVNSHGAEIPDTSANWTFAQAAAMPYMETANVTVGGTTVGSWNWEYATTFTDDSGNGNTATPTFRTAASDADLTGSITDQEGQVTGSTPTANVTGGWTMIQTLPDTPAGLFDEGGDSYGIGGIDVGGMITDAADDAGQDATAWHIIFWFALAIMAMVGTYKITRNTQMGTRGSFTIAALVAELVLIYPYTTRTIPGFALIPLGILLLVLILWRKSPSPVD